MTVKIRPLQRRHQQRHEGEDRHEDGAGAHRLADAHLGVDGVRAPLILRQQMPEAGQQQEGQNNRERVCDACEEEIAAEQPQRPEQMSEVFGNGLKDGPISVREAGEVYVSRALRSGSCFCQRIVRYDLRHRGEPEVAQQGAKLRLAAIEVGVMTEARLHWRANARLTGIDFPRMHIEHERFVVAIYGIEQKAR